MKKIIAGVDEVGRGPLCGPVVAAAVILPRSSKIEGVNDSKKISPKKREALFDAIKGKALSIGLGFVHEDKIDEINILNATMLAMKRAVQKLDIMPDTLLVDGSIKDITDIPQRNIIKGDSKSLSIAAASIIAKVTRDRMMIEYNKIFPSYGLSKNMGYGTKEHMHAIKTNFSTPIHRQTFKPISSYIPKISDIPNIKDLSIKLAACKIVRSGHKIISINCKSLNIIDIISIFNNQCYGFKLYNGANIKRIRIQMMKEYNSVFLVNNIKKDITSSINISVISVKFSNNKPEITFKNI